MSNSSLKYLDLFTFPLAMSENMHYATASTTGAVFFILATLADME